MIKNFKKYFFRTIVNLPGWRTKRKIVVFESDDWGSIRIPSREIYELFIKKNIRLDKNVYNKYDSLASENDLSKLFDVLYSVKDKKGNNAVLTVNTVVANPDFKKIRNSGFNNYYYKLFIETLTEYPDHNYAFELWKKGIKLKIFIPQFHGREHFNILRWMKSLKENIGKTKFAFDYKVVDLSESHIIEGNSYMDALNFESEDELEFQKQSLSEGLKLFENIFGYKSDTFVAPNYIWSRKLNETLFQSGIKGFQGIWYQFEPLKGKKHKFKKTFHYMGQKNNLGQIYMIRNANFEPSSDPFFDWNYDILSRMNLLFNLNKPVIIGTHRVNYIGFIDKKNSDRNLLLFSKLLKNIINKHPDVEFMSSAELLNLIINNK